jgi:hypothetical protein
VRLLETDRNGSSEPCWFKPAHNSACRIGRRLPPRLGRWGGQGDAAVGFSNQDSCPGLPFPFAEAEAAAAANARPKERTQGAGAAVQDSTLSQTAYNLARPPASLTVGDVAAVGIDARSLSARVEDAACGVVSDSVRGRGGPDIAIMLRKEVKKSKWSRTRGWIIVVSAPKIRCDLQRKLEAFAAFEDCVKTRGMLSTIVLFSVGGHLGRN